MTAILIGPGGCVGVCDQEGDRLEIRPDGSIAIDLLYSGADVSLSNRVPVVAAMTDENGAPFTQANPLPVEIANLVIQNLTVAFPDSILSVLNSPTTPLGANATFTGGWEEVMRFSAISAIVLTDQNSALNGAVLQFSNDAATVLRSVAATIPAGVGLSFIFSPEARYFRIVYTNGSTPQGSFITQTILHYQPPIPPQLPLGATVTDLTLAEMNQSGMRGRKTTGQWIPVLVTATGQLEVNAQTLPLPAGAATEATLLEIGTDIDTIETSLDVALSTRATEVTLAAILADTADIEANLDVVLSTRASDSVLQQIRDKIPDQEGAWSYRAGVSGTVTVGAGLRVIGIAAVATDPGATVVINGGDTIPVPTFMGVDLCPKANLTAPVIIFSGTTSFLVELVGA